MPSTPEFDYVIVGAGSAGCVLAGRLSADPSVRVLLLEAGGWDWHPLIRIPLGVGRIWGFDRFDWGYETEPEPHAGGRRIETARGKVIGGSHSINAMGYIRGHRGDYDRWASHQLPGWSYEDVLPYFKRAETWEDGETPHRGGNGPLYVRKTKDLDPLYGAYIEAGLQAGHPFTEDYNGAEQHGFAWAQWTIRRGRRDTTARGYLHPALRRGNLAVCTNAPTQRIVLEGQRAVGVEFRRHGASQIVRAAREVIVCAGSINTPQLLMLSGIGDPDHLRQFSIDVRVPRRDVGCNLQDHYSTGLAHERREPGPFVAATRFDRLAFNFARAYVAGTGPATDVPSGFMAFVKTDPALAMPDIQFLFRSGPSNAGPWFPGIRSAWQDAFICRPILLRPKSRGTIRLRSADPNDRPRIQQNFLSDGRDLPVLRTGLRLLREVAAQPALKPFCGREIGPGDATKSDAEVDNYIRQNGATAHHPCGTCRMGADSEAVVDAELRVNGVEGLRIADASVMPDLVGGNINAAVIMIAEKAADMIRGTIKPR
ncbi:GMC family oxidoreductase [Rhodoplanes sp. Z2-YC6860]|uniref:GMC family oxidoreductase n=1 Tax=Rhodoplanes sp. Z2-YC6860 TaxID=674703 RepID=UPI00078BAAFA|nr:choline dehydrogenase [Rhodoplanes sp. Z2-YC6860]AMN43968.1 glucose-methanol-choline oxidoreductase [Rhodoplanes sp. Z2-YC6860]